MGAITWGADIAGPAVAASVVEDASDISHRHAEARASAYNGGNGTHGRESAGELWARTEQNEVPTETGSDRESLEAVYGDFRKLKLREPHLVMADIADAESSLRRPE